MSFIFFVFFWYILINIISFVLMFYDKNASKYKFLRKHRIRERTLLLISIIGGCLGSILAMYLFSHKTKHKSFILTFWFSLLLHIIILKFLIQI